MVHEGLADESVGYTRQDEVLVGELGRARDVGLWLSLDGATVTVERLPGWAAYPRPRPSARLFTLGPGQIGRYRANFRFTGCACNPSWFYETWVVHVSNGNVNTDRFIQGRPDHDVDDRTSLRCNQVAGRARAAPVDGSGHRADVHAAATSARAAADAGEADT